MGLESKLIGVIKNPKYHTPARMAKIIKLMEQFPEVNTKNTRRALASVLKKQTRQTGGGFMDSITKNLTGKIGSVASGFASKIASQGATFVKNHGEAIAKQAAKQAYSVAENTVKKTLERLGKLDCDREALAQCAIKEAPNSGPAATACAAAGAGTMGTACAPLLATLATSGGKCVAAHCKV